MFRKNVRKPHNEAAVLIFREKVNCSYYFIKHQAMKTYGGVEVFLHHFCSQH
jgi:hypothetical protein